MSRTMCCRRRIDVVRTRAQPLGIDVDRRAAASAAADADCFAALLQYPGANGDVRDYRALADCAARAGCAGDRRRRPARADAADAARRMGRRRRRRIEPALRRADGFRRSARGVPRHARRIQAQPAGPAGRRDRRCQRRARVSGSRCRPASSTSAAKRRRRTSAPRRCCSR